MTEQLLDRPEVRATLEEMGREGVPQGVRVDRALRRSVARPRAQAAPDVARGEPASRLGEEQRAVGTWRAGAAREAGTAALEPARDGLERLLADGHEARLAALAL